jgi:multisubunit Na+/H+ antiporter MnhG subunit
MYELLTTYFSDILKCRQIYEDKIHRTCFTKRGVLVTCLLVFTVFCIVCTVFFVLFRLCIFILICFVCTSVRTTATE